MAIAFNEIPGTLRVPFVTAEFDASQASQGPSLLAYSALLIGQKTASGTGSVDTLYRVTSAPQVSLLAGRGSILHRKAIAWFAVNRLTELWIGILGDGAGAAATGTFTITGTATAGGVIPAYLGGVRIPVAVTDGDAPADIATNLAAAINADADLPVTAGAAAGVVTVTFRNLGEVGNAYDLRINHGEGEVLPAGVTDVAVAAMSGGTVNPALTNLIAAMGDTWFQIIAHPYTDAASLTAIENELSSRFGPLRMIDGVAFSSAQGSQGVLTSLGNGRNSQHSSIMSQAAPNPLTPPMEFAAETAALVALSAAIDPARPFTTLAYKNARAPAESDLFMLEERNMLLFDGIGTTRVAAGSVVQVERPITTFQTNASGAPDDAYLDVTTMLTLLYLRFDWRVRIQTKYPRHKLADDGTRFGDGQPVMTPKLGKAEALTWFREKERQGLVEGFDQFKADLVVERDAADPNRLNLLLPPDLINQLLVTAAQFAFRL